MSEIAKIKGYDIRDKKLADATSQNSVASTDAIRMKTTGGDEVYITRDSFVDAIASVFKSNSKSTITTLFGEETSGNTSSIGSINMSNLGDIFDKRVSFQKNMLYYAMKITTTFNGKVYFDFADDSNTQAGFSCKIRFSGGQAYFSGTRIEGGKYYLSYNSSSEVYTAYIYSTSYGNVDIWNVKKTLTYGGISFISVEDVPSGLTEF